MQYVEPWTDPEVLRIFHILHDFFMTNPAVNQTTQEMQYVEPWTDPEGLRVFHILHNFFMTNPAVNQTQVTPNTISPCLTWSTARPTTTEDDIRRLEIHLVDTCGMKKVTEVWGLCAKIFKDGVNAEALQKPLTKDQSQLRGKQFRLFFENLEIKGQMKNKCRLCPVEYKSLRAYKRGGRESGALEHIMAHFKLDSW